MVTTKQDVLDAIDSFVQEIEDVAGRLAESDWDGGVYENGWNARQLLCHIASTAGIAGFVLTLARAPVAAGVNTAAGYDNEAFNNQQVQARQNKPLQNVLNEIRETMHRDRQVVSAAPDQLLASMFRAPWGTEGTVAGVIADSINEHLRAHLRDLEAAVGAN